MTRNRHGRRMNERGFTIIEMAVALVVFVVIGATVYQVLRQTNQSERMGSTLSEAQQNGRAALDVILRDLREAGYGIDADTVVPIETASEYRITVVIDGDADGTVGPGERITYFVDADPDADIVSDTPNPYDFLLRRIISDNTDSLAVPVTGQGEIVAYGVTQRTPDHYYWDVRLFDYLDENGISLLGQERDPDGSEYGYTVPDSSLGKPAGGGVANLIDAVQVEVVTESSHMDPETHTFRQARLSGTIHPRNLGLSFGGTFATRVDTSGEPDDTGTGDTGTGEVPPDTTDTGEEPPLELPDEEPPIRIPTERILSLVLTDLSEVDSQEGSLVSEDGQHDLDIIVGTQASGANNLQVWFEGLPDRYPPARLYNSVPNYFGNSSRDINWLVTGNLDESPPDYVDVVSAVSISDVSGGFEVWLNQAAAHPGWLGAGDMTTLPNTFYSEGSGAGTSIQTADMDNDGDLDVLLGTRTGENAGAVEVWLNSGAGTFAYEGSITAAGEVHSLVAADFNRDGWMDFAAGTRSGTKVYDGMLEVWLNLGGGAFSQRGPWDAGGKINALAMAWMDENSSVDLVAGLHSGNRQGKVELWLNDGSGTMTLVDEADADDEVMALAVGQIDYGNYSMDIVAGTAARSLQAWFCDPNAAKPGDIIPPVESWSDANTGGVVNALAIGKVEAPTDHPWRDPLNDIVVGTSIGPSTGEIIIYLNPYVWTLAQ